MRAGDRLGNEEPEAQALATAAMVAARTDRPKRGAWDCRLNSFTGIGSGPGSAACASDGLLGAAIVASTTCSESLIVTLLLARLEMEKVARFTRACA